MAIRNLFVQFLQFTAFNLSGYDTEFLFTTFILQEPPKVNLRERERENVKS